MGIQGAAGGALKFLSGAVLIYYMALFSHFADELSVAREKVLSAGGVGAAEEILLRTVDNMYSFVELNAVIIIALSLLWIVGSSLLAGAWDAVTERWPMRAKLLYRTAALLSVLLVLLGIVYLARPLLERMEGPEGVLGYLSRLELSWALPFLFSAPLALPIVRGLLVLLYFAEGSRLGAAFLLVGGLAYGAGAFQVYRIFSPFNEVRAEIAEALSAKLTEDGLLELIAATLGALKVMMNRTEGLVLVISVASLLYGIGFLLLDRKLLARVVGEERAQRI